MPNTAIPVEGSTAFLTETTASTDVESNTTYLTEHSEENVISIQLPEFQSENGSKINQLVADYITQKINNICNSECHLSPSKADIACTDTAYSKYFVDLTYRISYQSDDIISIIFEGKYNYKKAAHPTNIFFSLNIDPKNAQRVFFSEVYSIESELYQLFSTYAQQSIIESAGGTWPDGWGSFSESVCGEEQFLEGMKTECGFYSYYTGHSVGISYPVPHSIGDYLVVEIPQDELRLNPTSNRS